MNMAFGDMDKTNCRTCFDPGKSFFTLSETVYETKSLLDLLIDIVRLQVPADDPLPKMICCRCANRLKSAFDFITQAQDVNDKYMKLLNVEDDPLKSGHMVSGCLEESTIDIPMGQYIADVKLEEGNPDQFNVVLGLNKNDQVSHDGVQGEAEDELDALLTTQTGNFKSDNSVGFFSDSDFKDLMEMEDDDMDNTGNISCSSSAESNYEPDKRKVKRRTVSGDNKKNDGKKRRVGRQPPDYFDKIIQINDRYGCFMCQKTFSLRKDCGRHIASIHLQQVKFTCEYCGQDFSRKDKVRHHVKRMHSDRPVYPKGKHRERVFGDRLYGKPNKWLFVECKICSTQYATTKELRLHMEAHTVKDTLNHLDMQSEVIKHLFTNAMSLECVKDDIMKDISEKQWFKYYTVLNQYSYEMSISDTEEEDVEAGAEKSTKYKCDLCYLEMPYKFEAYNHLKEVHGNDEIPLKCGLCKLEFVSTSMFEHHSKTHCRNRNKVLLCTRCPAKFVWPENMRNHTCATTGDVKIEKEPMKCHICERAYEVKTKLLKHIARHEQGATLARMTIRCGLCEQTFDKLEHLRKHITIHADGTTGIDFKNSMYMKIFEKSKKLDIALLHQEIQNAFKSSQISRFYKAIDKEGNELDINDSDSESDDEGDIKCDFKCEICGELFARRKMLMRHQQAEHNDVPLPFTCDDCMKQFVSNDLLQQHLHRDCWNEHRRVAQQCEYCNARFIWQSNLIKHKEIQHKNQQQSRPKRARTLKCEYCDKVFIWPKDLVRHKKTHTEGKQFSCPHCDRKFQRKDNLLVHIRTHDPDVLYLVLNTNRMIGHVLPNLAKPHGCKRIVCMICHSEHNRIRDLRSHLRSHQYATNFDVRKEKESIPAIAKEFYPDNNITEEAEMVKRIAADLCSETNLERFYSITNENGYEVNLDSSETESESEDDEENDTNQTKSDRSKRIYKCDLCPNLAFNRKYKIYEHQRGTHKWEEAQHICVHCNSRFVSSTMLQLHYKEQCKNAKKRHFCRRCPLRFMWKNNLKAHVAMDHAVDTTQDANNSSRFDCFLCQRVFLSQKDLSRHMSSIHSAESELHYCLLCPKTFYGINHLNDHLSGHRLSVSDFYSVESIIHSTCWPNADKSIKCMICMLEFATLADLKEHYSPQNPHNMCSTHHSIANYSVTNQKGFELNIELDSETEVEDLQEREGEARSGCKPYICSICNVSCERKYQMAQHQRSMHNYETLPLKCTQCIFRTVCQRIMDYHTATQCQNTEKLLQCQHCNFKFMWQDNLQHHITLIHQSVTMEPTLETKALEPGNKTNEINIFECMECHRRYNRRDRYKAHFKKFHSNSPEAAEAIAKAKASAMKTKHFLCPFCGVNFSSNSNLTVHMRRHTGEKPYKCDLCEMAFPRTSDLQSHYRTHTGERPYKCEFCDKAFSRQYKLNVHVRVHTGERPYACTYCPKSFAQSNDLTLHVRRHTGERPYACEVCGEGFICATTMNKHQRAKGHQPVAATVKKDEKPTTQIQDFELNF